MLKKGEEQVPTVSLNLKKLDIKQKGLLIKDLESTHD